jgi:CAAX protease family protein
VVANTVDLPSGLTGWRAALRAGSWAVAAAAVPAFGTSGRWWSLSIVLVAVLWTRDARAALVLGTFWLTAAAGLVWPVPCLAAGVVWFALDARRVRPRRRWPRPRILALCAATGAVAGAAVIAMQPGSVLGALWFGRERPSTAVLIAIVVVAAFANGIGEEVLWRGWLHAKLAGTSRVIRTVLIAASFGAAHVHGIPSGWLGICAAGLYSVVVTYTRERSGFIAGVVMHVATDLVVFSAVAATASFAFEVGAST